MRFWASDVGSGNGGREGTIDIVDSLADWFFWNHPPKIMAKDDDDDDFAPALVASLGCFSSKAPGPNVNALSAKGITMGVDLEFNVIMDSFSANIQASRAHTAVGRGEEYKHHASVTTNNPCCNKDSSRLDFLWLAELWKVPPDDNSTAMRFNRGM